MPATARTRGDTNRDVPWSPAADPSDDPFADLVSVPAVDDPDADPFGDLDPDEAEDTLHAAGDDLGSVRDLFGTRKQPVASAALIDTRRAVGGSGWPGHNYNEAYRSLQVDTARRGGGPRRRPGTRAAHELWEVDDLAAPGPAPVVGSHGDDARIRAALADAPVTGAPAASATDVARSYPGIPVSRPWPASAHRDPTHDADEWLDALSHTRASEATVAQLIAGVPLHRVPAPLVDVTDTLHARPRGPRHAVGTMRDVPAAYDPPSLSKRALRVTTTIAVTLFALALIQLLILSL